MYSAPQNLTAIELNEWLNSYLDKPLIIDVRESMELDKAKLELTSIYIPMSKVSFDYVAEKLKNYSHRKFVIMCHMGIRSYNFGHYLLENNFVEEVWNLSDGIDGWSKSVDSDIPLY